MNRLQSVLVVLMTAVIGTACVSVDATEHCVKTRFGKIVNEHMSSGFNNLMLHDAECFSMIDQNFPTDGEVVQLTAQTAAPVTTVTGNVSVIFAYDPNSVFNVFLDKRSENSAHLEVQNAIESGYRNAIASWTVDDIFSEKRADLGEAVKGEIQALLAATDSAGNSYQRAIIKTVFIQDIQIPSRIEEARIEATRQQQILDQAQQQFVIDSVNARAIVISAEADAESVQLQANAYAANPALLQLEIARAYASGLAGICTAQSVRADGSVTETVAANCIVGGSVADLASIAVIR